MSHSLVKFYVHIVFHVKNDKIKIRKQDKERLYAYMATVIKDNESNLIRINGVENHVHILCTLSKNIAFSKFMELIKKHSSRWIKTMDVHYEKFAWQTGYAGFSVSPSVLNKTIKYIENQEKHHQKMSYKDELEHFLKMYKIEYDEKYLWED